MRPNSQPTRPGTNACRNLPRAQLAGVSIQESHTTHGYDPRPLCISRANSPLKSGCSQKCRDTKAQIYLQKKQREKSDSNLDLVIISVVIFMLIAAAFSIFSSGVFKALEQYEYDAARTAAYSTGW